jgi:hypothetical protein
MAVIRQLNLLSQQRLDLSHLRSIESAVAGDFDAIVGRATAGGNPQVLRGLEVTGIGAGAAASSLELAVADAIVYHLNASESGSFLWVSESQAPEVLNPLTNGTVTGSWTSSSVNYVGVDFSRAADVSTTDLVQFLDANNLLEVPRSVPLAKTLNYVINISTVPFSSNSNLVPVAIVTLDSSGLLTAISDARPMLFRLGSGGDVPDIYNGFAWGGGRAEGVTALTNGLFIGGDKAISSQKDWQDAVMTRLWEQGGGEFWYSATADRNVNMIWTGATFTNGENFEWVGGANLHWKGIKFLFDDSAGYYNTVSDQAGSSAGLTDLADGECIYVDLDRTSNATVAGVKAVMSTLGPGSVPGSRWIMAWRYGANVYTRNWRYPVGTTFTPATTTSQGVVKLSMDYNGTAVVGTSGLNDPIVISDRGGIITPTGGLNYGLFVVDNGGTRGGGSFTAGLLASRPGLVGYGGSGGAPGTTASPGLYGEATSGANVGVKGSGFGAGAGVQGVIGGTGPCFEAYGASGTVKSILTSITGSTKAQVGTTTNHPFNFITNNTEVWSMTAAGVLTSIGGPRAIQSVLDPVTAQDAATKNYADAKLAFNAVHNSDFNVWQRNLGRASADYITTTAAFCADRWYAYLAAGGGATEFKVSRQAALYSDSPGYFNYCLRVQRKNGSTDTHKASIVQEIDRSLVKRLRGKTIYVSVYHREGANYVNAAGPAITVLSGTSATLSETLKGGYTVGSTSIIGPTTVTLNTSTTNFVRSTVLSAVVPAAATTLAIQIGDSWSAAAAGADQWFDITGITLSTADIPWANAGGDPSADFRECQRYFEKSYDHEVAVGFAGGVGANFGVVVTEAGGLQFSPGIRCAVRKAENAGPFVVHPYDISAGTIDSVDTDDGVRGAGSAYEGASGCRISLGVAAGTLALGDYVWYQWTYSAEFAP